MATRPKSSANCVGARAGGGAGPAGASLGLRRGGSAGTRRLLNKIWDHSNAQVGAVKPRVTGNRYLSGDGNDGDQW
jgi:hypothetical protein